MFAKVPIRKFDFVLEVIGEFVSPEEGERREENARRTNKDMAFLMYQIQADNGEDIW